MTDVFVAGVNTRTGEVIAGAPGPQGGVDFFCDPRDLTRRWFLDDSLPIFYDQANDYYVALLADGRPFYYFGNGDGTYSPRPNPGGARLTPGQGSLSLTTPYEVTQTWTGYPGPGAMTQYLLTQSQAPVADGVAYTLTIQRDNAGRAQQLSDSAGVKTTVNWNLQGVITITAPDALEWLYLANQLQDPSWQLTSAQYPVGTNNKDQFTYSNQQLGSSVATIANAPGDTTTFNYCPPQICGKNGVAKQVTNNGRSESVGFDFSGAPTTVVHYPGGVPDEKYTYGNQGFTRRGEGNVNLTLLQSTLDSTGTTTTPTWDGAYPALDRVQDSFGHFTAFKYSGTWAPAEVDDDYAGTPEFQVTAWDQNGFLPAAATVGGRAFTGMTYNGAGELTSVTNGPNTFTMNEVSQNGVTTRAMALNGAGQGSTTSNSNGYLTADVNADGTQETYTPDQFGLDHGDTDERGAYFAMQYDPNLLPTSGNDSSGASWQLSHSSALPSNGSYTGPSGLVAQSGWSFTPAALSLTSSLTVGGVQNVSATTRDAKSNPTTVSLNGTTDQGYTNPDLGGQGGVCQ
jgi:hypothetical protein